jgi:signal transduction histidine kinase
VFDRFTRLDDARTRDAGGAGLGLAIVGELVRLHAGTVTLGDAAPGLRVAVALPGIEAPDETLATSRGSGPTSSPSSTPSPPDGFH